MMFSFQTIERYQQQLLAGETTCTSAVEYYLNNINNTLHLNAFVEVYAAEAIEKAKELDNKRALGNPIKKMHGVVVAIKDVICYQNHRVTAASKILQGFSSLYTATALQLLIEEEAIIIGNCNCDEFAMGSSNEHSVYGKVLNALDNERVPGGSSGGSAVAVQANCCMVSLGSDTGGSVRQPADFCGIIGCKPGYGSISRYGLIAYASSFDQIGVFARCIEDVKLLLEVMCKNDGRDSTMHTIPLQHPAKEEPYSFVYFREMIDHPSLDPEIAEAFQKQLKTLQAKGYQVTELAFDLLNYIVPTYYILTTAEASSNLARYDGVRYGYSSPFESDDLAAFYSNNRSEGFGEEVKRRIMLGTFVLSAGYFDAYFNKALQVRRLLHNRVKEIYSTHTAILSPVSPTVAFRFNEKSSDPTQMYLADIYTVFANLTGIAAISLPLFKHSNGMPFGLQVMCNNGDELTLLSVSSALLKEN